MFDDTDTESVSVIVISYISFEKSPFDRLPPKHRKLDSDSLQIADL
jgi:hypothetical protein